MKGWHYLLLIVLFSAPLILCAWYISVLFFMPSQRHYGGSPLIMVSMVLYSYGIAIVSIPVLVARIIDLVRQGRFKKSRIVVFSIWYGVGVLTIPPIAFFLWP
jgi:hypothetical protein